MLPAITTTHAIPQHLPSGSQISEDATVRCSYCLEVLGTVYDRKDREQLKKTHKCMARRLAKKPAASVPYN
ncbi:MAG: hypothetical protein WA634_08055 [Silvibacterium sp.]